MQLGMIGLGRMGANMVRRLMRGGHFVKLIHNGIEYGMMAAYAEGLNILKHAGVGKGVAVADAETPPLRVLAAALFSRVTSRGEADFQNRLLSAMRSGFGGHKEGVAPAAGASTGTNA